jgi:hypothetical protein
MIRSHESESPTNQMSKDKIWKKKITQKDLKKFRVKKKLIRGQIKNFSWKVKLNWKITLTKQKTNQKNEG